jgi:hypothetical protein
VNRLVRAQLLQSASNDGNRGGTRETDLVALAEAVGLEPEPFQRKIVRAVNGGATFRACAAPVMR